jgi:hypothetical protein
VHHHVVPVKERLIILALRLYHMLLLVDVLIVILKIGLGEGVLVARSKGLVGRLDGPHVT